MANETIIEITVVVEKDKRKIKQKIKAPIRDADKAFREVMVGINHELVREKPEQ